MMLVRKEGRVKEWIFLVLGLLVGLVVGPIVFLLLVRRKLMPLTTEKKEGRKDAG
jgi:uncharacterized membrane-anchored protein YhcB (DUF1043 family)